MTTVVGRQKVSGPSPTSLFPLATTPVSLIATAVALVLLATSTRYGYFADELYSLAAGRQLTWAYADQPPLIPLLAVAADSLFPGSLVALRIPPMLVTAAGVFLVALITRELGGDRRAQVLGAGAWAVTLQFVSAGHLLVTWALDPFLWTVVTWLLVRWTRVRDDHLLLWAGVVTAVALQVKLLIPAFWISLLLAVLAVGPRDLLRRPMLWCGAGVSMIALSPVFIWQYTHGWPQLQMPTEVAAESWSRWQFLPMVLVCAGLMGAVLICFGLWRLLRAPELRAYRYLGWTTVAVAVLFTLSQGRPYYMAGLFGLLYAVAVIALPRWKWTPVYALSACLALGTLPILPASVLAPIDVFSRASIGWPQVTSAVANAYRHVPSDAHKTTAVLTHDYWSASALDHYGPQLGIRQVYSGSRGFWYLRQPPENTKQVLYLGGNPAYLHRFFHNVRQVTTVDTGLNTYYERTPIWLAEGPRQPWRQLWPQLRRMDIFDGSSGSGTELPGQS